MAVAAATVALRVGKFIPFASRIDLMDKVLQNPLTKNLPTGDLLTLFKDGFFEKEIQQVEAQTQKQMQAQTENSVEGLTSMLNDAIENAKKSFLGCLKVSSIFKNGNNLLLNKIEDEKLKDICKSYIDYDQERNRKYSQKNHNLDLEEKFSVDKIFKIPHSWFPIYKSRMRRS